MNELKRYPNIYVRNYIFNVSQSKLNEHGYFQYGPPPIELKELDLK